MDLTRQFIAAINAKCRPESIQLLVDRGAIVHKTDTIGHCINANASPGIFNIIYESYEDDDELITTDNIFKTIRHTEPNLDYDSDDSYNNYSTFECSETVFEDMTIYEYIKYQYEFILECLRSADTDDITSINKWAHRGYNLKEYMKICGIKEECEEEHEFTRTNTSIIITHN